MIYETIRLNEKNPDCTLTCYVCDQELPIAPRRAVIVCPGGGYGRIVAHEGEVIARKYFGAEMNVYILRYSVGEKAVDFAPIIEAALAVKYIREHAKEHNTDPDKIFISGFSAGGHLAAACGILWNSAPVRAALGIDEGKAPEGINRPNGMILGYPVISGCKFGHLGSFQRLTGKENPTEEEIRPFSLEIHVDETTPPVFVWHTFADNVVHIKNSIMLIDALTDHGIPFEAHIYPEGIHGLSLANEASSGNRPIKVLEHVQTWMDLSIRWINNVK